MPSSISKDNSMLPHARELRRDMTPQERKLWYMFLRRYPVKIYKQRIIGSFIVDFYCASAKLVIEADGSQHYSEEGLAYDVRRSACLASMGLQVLRFTNHQIDHEFRSVCEAIDTAIMLRRA